MANSDNETAGIVGTTIGSQFQVLKRLGAGGMGAVYLAEQIDMDRKVVVKVMHPELTAGSLNAVERFKREAKAVAQLNHPNIVQVYVFGQTDGQQMYIAMEFIDGRDLTSDLKQGRLEQTRVLRILDQICSALIEAHGAGIVHRDLKPDNIMLADRHGNPDYVKVLDFGIAKMAAKDNEAQLTAAGAVFGTPRYMAPEQASGNPIDARTDIYALGIILYEMLTGEHPFQATTAVDYIVKHVREPVPPPTEVFEGLDVSPRVEAILKRTTEKDPAARYQSVRELQRDVRLALRDFPEAARGFPTGPTPIAPLSRKPASTKSKGKKSAVSPWLWVVGGVVAAGAIAAGLIAGLQGESATKDPGSSTVATVGERDPGGETLPLGEAPTTDVKAGTSIEGFPVPAAVRETVDTPQALVYETEISGRKLMEFYKATLHGKYDAVKPYATGIMIEGNSPFATVSIMAAGDRRTLVLSRNAMYEAPEGTAPSAPTAYKGITFMAGSTVAYKMPHGVGMRVRKPYGEVCKFYVDQVVSIPKVNMLTDLEAEPPYCTITATEADLPWVSIVVTPDTSSKGAILTIIQPKQ